MTDDQIIDQIVHSFLKYNLRDIKVINDIKDINGKDLDFTIAEFILCSCFIDQISGFRYNVDRVGWRYKKFVQDYLSNYNEDELYNDLRNKLVHNYSTGGFYGLTRKAPHLHLLNVNGVTHLNLENFIDDLERALNTYILEIKNDVVICRNALSWYNDYKILTLTS